MSINGTISFYQRRRGKGSLRTRFARLIELTGAEHAYLVSRSRWPLRHDDLQLLKLANVLQEPYTVPVEEVIRMRRGLGAVLASLHAPAFSERMRGALEAEIPEGIRDQFAPSEVTVRIGWHLLDDLAPGHEGPDPSHRRAARLSLTLFGYSAPRNWAEYRRLIWQTSAMLDLEAQIAEAIGPVRRAISWSV
jgi:hypothetical protein